MSSEDDGSSSPAQMNDNDIVVPNDDADDGVELVENLKSSRVLNALDQVGCMTIPRPSKLHIQPHTGLPVY